MKEKSIVLSKYFELVKPEYIFIKITPDKSIRNYNTTNIAKAIAYTYKAIGKRIRREQKKIFFETSFKTSYIIDITANEASFYFLIPKPFKSILVEKISEIWPKATISEVDGINKFSDSAICYQLTYKNEDGLSLAVDKKSNEPLNSLMNIIDILQEDDRITVIYNFIPRSQRGWAIQHDQTIEKFINRQPVNRDKFSIEYISKKVLFGILDILDTIISTIANLTGSDRKGNESLAESLATLFIEKVEISYATRNKKSNLVLDNQIAVISESADKNRITNNAVATCQSFRILDGDNELIYKKVKTIPKLEDYKFKNIDINTVSTEECQNFIQIPGRGLLEQYNIDHVNINEIQIPEQLRSGYFSLGITTYKGQSFEVFLEDEYNHGNLPLCIIGSQGSGKSEYIANVVSYAQRNGEGVMLIDYIKNCELSDKVCSVVKNENLVVIDLTKEECLQGFGYNEIVFDESMSDFKKLNLANLKAQYTLALVDAINPDFPLSQGMRRVLSNACNVVFVTGKSSIRDVVRCLEDFNYRHKVIGELTGTIKISLEDEINDLLLLDEIDKKTGDIIGTRQSKIDFILDRINLLRENFKLKYMFNKSTDNNINLVECMEQGKVVIIKMPQSEFPSKAVKNTIVTYWVTKMWATAEIRGTMHLQPKRTHLIIDEIFQAPTVLKECEYNLPQSRKFGLKTIISTQYIRQIESIFDTLQGSDTSFMMLKGTRENDFNKICGSLTDMEYEDLFNMKKFSSLNFIRYSGDSTATFITELPKPITLK